MCKFHHMFSGYISSFIQSLLECLFFLYADCSIFNPVDSKFLCPHYCRCPPGKYCCPQIKRIHLSDCQSPRAGPNGPPRMTLITGSPSLCPRPPGQVLGHPRQPWHQNTQLIGHYVVGLLETKIQEAKIWIYPDISNPEKNQWLKHGSG